jgi:hypothetical protein
MKKWYIIGYALCLSFLLASCYSFNHIQLPEKPADQALAKEIVKEVLQQTDKSAPKAEGQPRVEKPLDEDVVLCPAYAMPTFSKTPELPFEEILAADKNDPETLDKIRQDHIDELRQYIIRFKQELRTSYNEYLRACRSRTSKQAGRY